jgi:hypothetical protein
MPEAERYRKAATDTLKMLDWCIFYFRHEGRAEIATRLEKNCAYIRTKLTGEAEESLQAMGDGPQDEAAALNPVRRALDAIGLRPKSNRGTR